MSIMNDPLRRVFGALLIPVLASILTAQDSHILPSNNLIIDGIPQIPTSLAQNAVNYQYSFADSLLGWDPDKPEILIIRQLRHSWQVGRITAPGESLQGFTQVPAGCYETLYQRQGRSLIFRIDDTGGSEITQLYRHDIANGSSTLITDGKSRNLYPLWSTSGEWLMYSSARRNGKDLDLYVVNPRDPTTDRLVAQVNGEDWAAFDWSPDDRKAIISDYKSPNESYLWILDVASGQKTLLTPGKRGERVFNGSYAQFSADGKGVFHITDRASEFQRLGQLDIATGQYTYLTNHIQWDIEDFVLSPDRTLLAFVSNQDGISRLHLLTTTSKKEVNTPSLPTGVISSLRWHNNGKHLGFVLSSATSPGSVYSIDVKTGKLDQWTKSYAGEVYTTAPPEPELIRWKSFDGRTIPGFLYKPAHKFTDKRPVLIDIHGGPSAQYRPAFRGKDNYFTSELGVAMIYPNIRGSAGYGKTYLTLDNGRLREDAQRDIGALLDWIRTRPDLDAERVMVRGISGGAYVTLAVASSYGTRINGAIAVSGPSNLANWLESLDQWYRDRFREEYGDERDSGVRQYLDTIAPLTNVKKMKGPLLIIHGRLDARVAVSQSEQMIAAAKSEGIQVWSLLVRNGAHGFADVNTRDYVLFSEALFVQKYLCRGP